VSSDHQEENTGVRTTGYLPCHSNVEFSLDHGETFGCINKTMTAKSSGRYWFWCRPPWLPASTDKSSGSNQPVTHIKSVTDFPVSLFTLYRRGYVKVQTTLGFYLLGTPAGAPLCRGELS
jgi:hypothetical protein